MAQKILGTKEAASALDAADFQPFIARFARPFGLAVTEIWHRQLDRMAGVKPIR